MNPSIELDGLREALDALKKMGGTPADAKSMNKQVVDEIIVPAAKGIVPVRSGNLKGSIDSDSTATAGYILAYQQRAVSRFREDQERQDIVEARASWDSKIVAADAGYLIKSAA